MSYIFQTYGVGEQLPASKLNQTEINVRDHVHGEGGVGDVPRWKPYTVQTSIVEVTNTSATMTLGWATVSGALLGNLGAILFEVRGEMAAAAASDVLRLWLTYGAFSTVLSLTGLPSSPAPFRWSGHIQNQSATNKQHVQHVVELLPMIGTTGKTLATITSAAAVDTTAAQTLDLSGKFEVASTAMIVRSFVRTITIIKP